MFNLTQMILIFLCCYLNRKSSCQVIGKAKGTGLVEWHPTVPHVSHHASQLKSQLNPGFQFSYNSRWLFSCIVHQLEVPIIQQAVVPIRARDEQPSLQEPPPLPLCLQQSWATESGSVFQSRSYTTDRFHQSEPRGATSRRRGMDTKIQLMRWCQFNDRWHNRKWATIQVDVVLGTCSPDWRLISKTHRAPPKT